MASCAFNESDSIRIEGELETETFVSAVSASISEHEAFRLRFDAAGDFQFFAEEAGAAVAFHDLSVNSESERQSLLNSALKREALTPFDLEHGPLIRPQLFRIEERVHLFVLYAHHLVFDGYSSDLLIRDIVGRYRAAIAGETMNSSKTAPFSSYLVKTVGAEPLPAYWREIYADGPPPLLDLPTDYERPQEMSYRGATVRRRLSPSLCADLREVARRLGVSMSALTTAAFAALLSRLANREDLVVGTPVAGQARHGIEAVGYGVNVLPVRIRPERDASFAVLAKSVQAASLDAFENSDVSVSALIDAIDAPRLPGRVQLIEVVFNFAGYFAGLDAPGVKFSAYENRRFAVCQDLFVNVSDAGETLVIDLEYAADLFRAETIERWIDGYTAVLARIVRDPQTTPGEFDIAESRANIVAIADHQDRAAKTAVVETSASAPQSMTSTEQIVLEAAAATFARDDISIDDNFFDLGGHSIHASRLLTRLRRLRSQSLGIRAIFESESLRGLAAHIDANDNSEREEFVF
jgi:post-segregation antitoxin (ccd killing protein)